MGPGARERQMQGGSAFPASSLNLKALKARHAKGAQKCGIKLLPFKIDYSYMETYFASPGFKTDPYGWNNKLINRRKDNKQLARKESVENFRASVRTIFNYI